MNDFMCITFDTGARCFISAETFMSMPGHWLERVVSVLPMPLAMRDLIAARRGEGDGLMRALIVPALCGDCQLAPANPAHDRCDPCQLEADDFEWNVTMCADEHSGIGCFCPRDVVEAARKRLEAA